MPKKEGVINITDEVDFYSFSVMAATVFSASYEGARCQKAFDVIRKLKSAQAQLGIFGHVPWAWFFSPYLPNVFNASSGFHEVSQNMLDDRLAVSSKLVAIIPTDG